MKEGTWNQFFSGVRAHVCLPKFKIYWDSKYCGCESGLLIIVWWWCRDGFFRGRRLWQPSPLPSKIQGFGWKFDIVPSPSTLWHHEAETNGSIYTHSPIGDVTFVNMSTYRLNAAAVGEQFETNINFGKHTHTI